MITNISFNIYKPSFGQTQNKDNFVSGVKFQPIQDEFVSQKEDAYREFDGIQYEEDIEEAEIFDEDAYEEEKARREKQVKVERGIATGLCFLTAIGCGAAINHDYQQNKNKADTVLIDYVDDVSLIPDVVKTYGADLGMVAAYNMHNPFISDEKEGFYIPYAYNPAEEKIETLQKKLFDNDLDAMEANKIRVEIGGLEKKAERQHELAYAYREDNYVYFLSRDYVLTEEMEKAFDIKQGKLQKLNKETGKYEKHDGEVLSIGNTYRVKLKHIKD